MFAKAFSRMAWLGIGTKFLFVDFARIHPIPIVRPSRLCGWGEDADPEPCQQQGRKNPLKPHALPPYAAPYNRARPTGCPIVELLELCLAGGRQFRHMFFEAATGTTGLGIGAKALSIRFARSIGFHARRLSFCLSMTCGSQHRQCKYGGTNAAKMSYSHRYIPRPWIRLQMVKNR